MTETKTNQISGINVNKRTGKRRNKIRRESPVYSLIAHIILIIFALLCIIPFINMIAVSFSGALTYASFIPINPTLYSYKIVLTDWGFYRAFLMTLLVAGSTTFLSVIVMILAAYPLSKEDFPFRKGLMIFFIIIMLFSGGIIPNLLWYKMIGIYDTPLAIILPNVVQVFNLILIKNYFENIPPSLEESAKIDGASSIKVLFSIVIPLSIPVIVTVSLFSIVSLWNNYQSALYYIQKNTMYYPLSMYILNFIHSSGVNTILGDIERSNHKLNIEAAMILISILPILLSYPFCLKYFATGTIVGAVKE